MKSYSQNPREIQKELLRIIEDESLRRLIEIAYNAYRTLPYHSKTRKKIDEETDALLRTPQDSLLYETRYPMLYWIGAYVLYMIPENRTLLERYKRLSQEINRLKEKLRLLEPEYIEVTSTLDKLKEEAEIIDKKIDNIDKRIYKREIMLDSIDNEAKRNKIIKEIEALQKERDKLSDMYHNIYIKINKMYQKLQNSDIINEYFEITDKVAEMEDEKHFIEREIYRIMESMP